jgi:hypothetical protein
MALQYNLLRLVPITIFHRTFQIRAMVAVQVLENPILVLQAPVSSFLWLTFLNGGVGTSVLDVRGACRGD